MELGWGFRPLERTKISGRSRVVPCGVGAGTSKASTVARVFPTVIEPSWSAAYAGTQGARQPRIRRRRPRSPSVVSHLRTVRSSLTKGATRRRGLVEAGEKTAGLKLLPASRFSPSLSIQDNPALPNTSPAAVSRIHWLRGACSTTRTSRPTTARSTRRGFSRCMHSICRVFHS